MKRLPRSARKKPRVLFYSHDGLGLGHFRRTLAVAEGLARHSPGASRLLLTGLATVGAFDLPKSLDYVRMPGLDKSALFEAEPEKEPGAPASVFTVRQAVIAAVCEGFAPHLVVVDHSPTGVAGELLPLLKRMRRASPRPRFALGLRDITYGPERTRLAWRKDGTYELLEQVYDRILIYGSPKVFDPIKEYGFSPAIAAKTEFTGYFRRPERRRPPAEIRREFGADTAPFVVLSPGGGRDGADLIEAFLVGLRDGLLPGVTALVVAGPQMSSRDVAHLDQRAAALPQATFVRFRNDLESCIAAADAVVTMGGYNSVWEAIAAGKRPIIVPRLGSSDEQPLRAERVAALELATAVPSQELTPERLAQAICEELSRDSAVPENVDFNGLDRAGKALAKVLKR